MNKDVDKYQKLLDKLKLSKPVADKTQKYAIKSGDRNLKLILKKTGYYSALFGILLTLYRWMRVIGINATLLKSKILLSIITANAASALFLGGQYVAGKYILKQPEPAVVDRKDDANILAEKRVLINRPVSNIPAEKDSLSTAEIGIQPFSGDEETGRIITSKIASNLSENIGSKTVAFIKPDKKVKLDRVLMGSVRTFGDTSYITARIINVKDSSVLNVFSEEYKSNEDLDGACSRISKKIAEKLKK